MTQTALEDATTDISADLSVRLMGPARNAPVYRVDRGLLGWHGVATTSFMFRRDLLEIIVPTSTDQLRICADYYLVCFGHLLTGTLTIGRALSCFRRHRANNFSSSPLLGGASMIGVFPQKELVERLMVDHLSANIDAFVRVVGWPYCKLLISRKVPKRKIYRHTKRFPALQRYYSRSPLRFRLKYKLFYRLVRARSKPRSAAGVEW